MTVGNIQMQPEYKYVNREIGSNVKSPFYALGIKQYKGLIDKDKNRPEFACSLIGDRFISNFLWRYGKPFSGIIKESSGVQIHCDSINYNTNHKYNGDGNVTVYFTNGDFFEGTIKLELGCITPGNISARGKLISQNGISKTDIFSSEKLWDDKGSPDSSILK